MRHDLEVFGIDADDLMDVADVIYAAAYADSEVKNTNDSVRTGAYSAHGYGAPYYNSRESYVNVPVSSCG